MEAAIRRFYERLVTVKDPHYDDVVDRSPQDILTAYNWLVEVQKRTQDSYMFPPDLRGWLPPILAELMANAPAPRVAGVDGNSPKLHLRPKGQEERRRYRSDPNDLLHQATAHLQTQLREDYPKWFSDRDRGGSGPAVVSQSSAPSDNHIVQELVRSLRRNGGSVRFRLATDVGRALYVLTSEGVTSFGRYEIFNIK